MAPNRSEPFQLALGELRRRLTAGVYPSDARLTAGALAGELGLSPTPMREALARLTGEGLLEDRRGQGFFLRRLSARDVADLYALNLLHLELALAGGRRPDLSGAAAAPPEATGTSDAAVAASDRLFARWVADAGGAVLSRSFLRVQGQLAPVRRLEPRYLVNLEGEYLELARDAAIVSRVSRLRRYFRRRLRLAAQLAQGLEPRP